MGKDKRGIDRGRCKRCTCDEYEYVGHASTENHMCGYCGCPPTQHEDLSSSPRAAQDQNLSPHPSQLRDKCMAHNKPVYNEGGPNSTEELYARRQRSQEQASDPKQLLGIERFAGGRSSKNSDNFEVKPDLYSKPSNSDSGRGTNSEPSTPPFTGKRFQEESPYSPTRYQNQNLPHYTHATHRCMGYNGSPRGDVSHGAKQYYDKQTCGNHEHQQNHKQPQPSTTYGEHFAFPQSYGGKSSRPTTPHLQELQGKQEESMRKKNGPDQPQRRRKHHNTLPVYHQKFDGGKRSDVTTLQNRSQSALRSGNYICSPTNQLHSEVVGIQEQHDVQNLSHGSSSTCQELAKYIGEAMAGSAQSYDSSQSYSPHISHTSHEGDKVAQMKNLHQKLRKLEEEQTSVKRELQSIVSGVINLPVSELGIKANMELLPVQANCSDNPPTWKQPVIPKCSTGEKNLMEAKLILPASQNPLDLGLDVSRGHSLGIRPLHSLEQALQPAAKPLDNYDSDTDGNNQPGERGKGSREHDIGSSQNSILVESSELYQQQVSKYEDNSSTDNDGNKRSPSRQNALDQRLDISEEHRGSSNLKPTPTQNPRDSPQLLAKRVDDNSHTQSEETGRLAHIERNPGKTEFEARSKHTSENKIESRKDDGSSLDSTPAQIPNKILLKSTGDHCDMYGSEQSIHVKANPVKADFAPLVKQTPRVDKTGDVLRDDSSLGSTPCLSSEQETQQLTRLEDNQDSICSLHVDRNFMEAEMESPAKQNPVDQEASMSGGQQADSDSDLRSTTIQSSEQSLQPKDGNNHSSHTEENLVQSEVESPTRESPLDFKEEGSTQHAASAVGTIPANNSDQPLQQVAKLQGSDFVTHVTTFEMTVNTLHVTDGHLASVQDLPKNSQETNLELLTSTSDSESEEYFSASGSEKEVDDDDDDKHEGSVQTQDKQASNLKALRQTHQSVSNLDHSSLQMLGDQNALDPYSEMSIEQVEVSSSETSRNQDESVSSSEVSKPDEPVSSPEVSRNQDEPTSGSGISRKQDGSVSSSEVSRKQDEQVSSSEMSRKKYDILSGSEVSSKQDEQVSSSEVSRNQDEPISGSGISRKQDGSVSSSEVSRKQYEQVSSSEMSRKKYDILSGSEVSSKQDEQVSSSEVSRNQDEPISGSEVSRKQNEPLAGSEVSRKQNGSVSSSEVSRKQDEHVSSSEVSMNQDEPISCLEVSNKQDGSVTRSEVSKKEDGSVSSLELARRQDEAISGSEVSRKQDGSVSISEVSEKQDESVLSSEVSKKQNEHVWSSKMSREQGSSIKQGGPDSGSDGSRRQDEPILSSEVGRKQEASVTGSDVASNEEVSVTNSEGSKKTSVSSSEVPRKQDIPATSSDLSKIQGGSFTSTEELKKTVGSISNAKASSKQDTSVSSSEVLRKHDEPVSRSGVSVEQDVRGSSAQARGQDAPVSTSAISRGKVVSVSNSERLEEKGVPASNSETVNMQSDYSRNPTRLKWKDQHNTFHPTVHGKNIKIESNDTTARRDQCYTDGICFSQFPIERGCNVHLKIVESKKFKGSMRIGFTSKNPEDMSVVSLPAHSYPEVQQGFWIKPLHDKLAQHGYVVTYMVDSSGDVFYSINGREKGLFFSGVDVSCCLWAAIDVHGSTIAVQFANDQTVSDAVNRNIHEGDQVTLQVETVETLQLLQEGHGGMQRDLEKAFRDRSMGVAIRIDDEENVRVFYRKHNRVWCINPAALRKVGKVDSSVIIMEGDLVAIGNDLERIKRLQKDHGTWVETMERTLGKIGRVTKITHQGDLRLRVDGKTWTYNAKAVTKITMKKGVSGTSRNSGNCDKGLHYWKSGVAKVCTRCGECTAKGADCHLQGSPFRSRGSPCGCREKTGGCADCGMCHTCAGETDDEPDKKESKMAKLLRMLKKHAGHESDDSDEEEAHIIAVGDRVRVTTDPQTLPILQREAGLEWDEAMLQVIGMDGRATQVSEKSVTVHFPHHGRWSLVPGCLTKVHVRVRQKGGETYQKGELVRIMTDGRQLKRTQGQHDGYSRDMAAALGKTGCVMRCKDGSVKVDVTGMTWWFHPSTLSRAVLKGRESLEGLHIKDGDYVKVDVDAETFKTYQVCHGGYVDRMEKSVGDFGVVHHIDIDGDAVVYYPDGTKWCINAMSLGKVDPAECGQIDVSCVLEVADWVKVEADKDRIKRVQERTDCIRWQVGYYNAAGKVGQVRTTYPFNDVITVQIEGSGYPLNPKLLRRASPTDLKEVFGSGDITNPGFTRGDLVKIAVDINKLRLLQDGHGGFVDKMEELLGLVGSVSFIDRDGDVYVRFSIRRLCFNPYSLTKFTPEEDEFYVGDLVLIEPDRERFQDLQRPTKHGRYHSKMLPACGKIGRLQNVMDQDKVRVKVLGRNWVLNPQLVTRMGNPGLGTGDWKSATICAPNKHDWSTGRCLVCVKCGECTHYGRLCPAREKPGRYPGSLCGCGNGHAGCDDCGTCRGCAGELQIHEEIEPDGKDGHHEIGWQGDAMEKLDDGDCQSTSSEKAAAHKVISAVLKKMSQAVELMKKSEDKQSTDAASIKTILEKDLLTPFTKYVSSKHKKLMGDHLANIDAARVLLDQYLKYAQAEDIEKRDDQRCIQLECLELMRKLLIHCTNSSFEFCRTVGRCNLLATLLQDLSTFHKKTRDEITWPAIHSLVTTLYNCARVPENQEYFSSCNVVRVLTPFLRSKDEGIRITTLSCLAFIIAEDNLHFIKLNVDMAELVVSLLKNALDNPKHVTTRGGYQYPALQVSIIISVLVRNDQNKKILITNGVVDLLIRLIETGDDGEKESALLCIRRLADSDKISAIIRRETKVKELLLTMRKDRTQSKSVRDAVAMAVDVLEHGPPQETKEPTPGQGSISTIKCNDLLVGTPLGGGGFGVVFRGYHRRWMMNVAVKKLLPLPEEQKKRVTETLIEEANFMRRAQNAYRFIVPLYGVCVEKELTALVMDFMENGSVWDLMSRVKHIPWWALKWRILQETILGMNFLHSLDPQIIHHDLKSQNIMLDEDFHAKISDFGLSKYKHLASRARGSKSCCAGTITHIPPENLADLHLKAGEKFDVYSFGILTWEILTGQTPYENARHSAHIKLGVINGQRPEKKVIPKVGPNELPFFVTLMEECWHQFPEERPQFRELGERVQKVTQRANVQVAEAVYAVRTAIGKEKKDPEETQLFAAADSPDA